VRTRTRKRKRKRPTRQRTYITTEDETGFYGFTCKYISKDCPNVNPCVAQPCANFPLCGNAQPRWLLECKGGLCVQACDMMYGRIFEFSRFTVDDTCPVCLEAVLESVVYPCKHMVCAKCYGKTVFNDQNFMLLKKSPICFLEVITLGVMCRGRTSSGPVTGV
jgi:hypothetical protein